MRSCHQVLMNKRKCDDDDMPGTDKCLKWAQKNKAITSKEASKL